jgi:hypothetical protein
VQSFPDRQIDSRKGKNQAVTFTVWHNQAI